MPAQIPNGCLIDQNQFANLHFGKIRLLKDGVFHANSTTSKPLMTEPFASSNVFPCSIETNLAIFSKFFSIKVLNFEIILDLFNGVVSAQLNWLCFADEIALSKSSLPEIITSDIFSPFDGS